MDPLDSWLYAFLLLLCALGAWGVHKSKQKPMARFAAYLVLAALAIMLVAEVFVKIWQFQLARGF